ARIWARPGASRNRPRRRSDLAQKAPCLGLPRASTFCRSTIPVGKQTWVAGPSPATGRLWLMVSEALSSEKPDSPMLPPVIGHRGAAASAPENTLAGLRRAKALGCAWVEFDVRLTGDGALVLCHDAALERTTSGSGRVSATSLAAIAKCDAGSWFDPSFAGERM